MDSFINKSEGNCTLAHKLFIHRINHCSYLQDITNSVMRIGNIKSKRFCFFIYIECVCCDDAYHLKKIATNRIRSQLTGVVKYLRDIEYVVDKFHFKNHTDRWCKLNCIPYNSQFIQKVSSLYLGY